MAGLDMFRLDGQVALITGANSGLGWAMAEAMAQAGADVALAARRKRLTNQAAAKLRKLGHRAIAIKADMTKEAEVITMVQRTVAELGGLDIVIANVGPITDEPSLIEETLDQWQGALDADLTSTFLTVREAAKVMIPQKQGKVIITSSVRGLFADRRGRRLGFCTAKSGLINFTRSLAVHLAPHGIQVNCIAPGSFRTQAVAGGALMQEHPPEEVVATYARLSPANRIGEPEEIKGLAILLASSASSFMTGQIIAIDGGRTAW